MRRAALDRDRWRCQAEGCGRAGLLEVHHVTPLEHGGKPYSLSNTLTLCRGDHIRIHGGIPHMIPESYQYRNFHLVPTLMAQGAGYMLTRSPGPAASRLQSARRSFPKDDLFFREYIFAKCWEQGLHRRYGALLLGEEWGPLRDRLNETFGEPPDTNRR